MWKGKERRVGNSNNGPASGWQEEEETTRIRMGGKRMECHTRSRLGAKSERNLMMTDRIGMGMIGSLALTSGGWGPEAEFCKISEVGVGAA